MRTVVVALSLVAVFASCKKKTNGGKQDAPTKQDARAIDAPMIDAPNGSMADCTTYCDAIQLACTGADQQWDSTATCVASCMLLPAGTTGATTGNSLACRATETQTAMTDATHCVNAGPSGGGVCGTTCQGFCSIASVACPTDYPAAACATLCGMIPTTPPYNSTIQTGNTIECRLFYATLAPTDAAQCTDASRNMTNMCQ